MAKHKEFNEICIMGLGYIGLPTAALLANRGFSVTGVDIQQHVVDIINRGEIHIVEPELDAFVMAAINSKNLKATILPTYSDVFIIAVPTPFQGDFQPNLEYVFNATKAIAPFIKPGNLIILESTSPIGTTEKIADILASEGVDISSVYVAHCPERVLPGHVMRELIENDRVVGGINLASTEKAIAFYKSFVSGEVLATNARTAELCKLAENSYRDTNIAFANELSIICDKANINVWELRRLANRHPRVNILQPGCGVGGHCIAVDPWFIVADYPNEAQLIRKAREVNNYKSEWVIEKIKTTALEFEIKHAKKPSIALLGLSFKPNIDDLRESPAVYIVQSVIQSFAPDSIIVEPNIESHPTFKISAFDHASHDADILVVLVAHKEFGTINNSKKSNSIILDFCGVI
ncbi:UDP-N-acetyl-D-mannosamine dehydrogenase [Arundinibacter roseus]|uniref:UDP-N-acetyl-D-mannosamine dehydrogenase n=1 Tax=Arundinibacter roseus TaxID=2070510 RepID=A0A4R4JV70_9BACT|nr:UDP-N-acetyl-D-mannosamine dehydrogenase [Arundinibacter roseus]TDB58650.1 UDP-N-acetyl-D-mannosamine dehydrogenase [Arundinibacter roseus]